MNNENIQTISEVASKTQYGGAGASLLAGLTLNDWGIVAGIVIGSIGLLVNIYFKHKQFKLNQAYIISQQSKHRAEDVPTGLEKYLGDD